MRKKIYFSLMVAYFIMAGLKAQTVTWDTSDGSVSVHGGQQVFTTVVATSENNVGQFMTHINIAAPYNNFKGQHKGGIGTTLNNGEVTLKLFAYDRSKPGGKGDLVYGCKSTGDGFREETWVEITTGYLWWQEEILSNDIKNLTKDYKLYLPEACESSGNNELGWGLAFAGWAAGGIIVSAAAIGAAPFTMGTSILIGASVVAAGGFLGAAVSEWPEPCQRYGTPFQPVVVELVVNNATVTALNVPGGRELATPYEVFQLPKKLKEYRSPAAYPNYVMLCAHRGHIQWAAENSTRAIKDAITMGYDMVEIDVKLLSDSTVALLHDVVTGHTTRYDEDYENGPERVEDMDAEDLAHLNYVHPDGSLEKVPSLREILRLCQGKILINIDKVEGNKLVDGKYNDFFNRVDKVVRQEGMNNQVIYKARAAKYTPAYLDQHLPWMKDRNFTPVVMPEHFSDANALKAMIDQYKQKYHIPGVELIYMHDNDFIIQNDIIGYLKSKNIRVIQFPMWPETGEGNYTPNIDKYTRIDPNLDKRNDWDWVVRKGADMIISDRMELWKTYLETRGLRNK